MIVILNNKCNLTKEEFSNYLEDLKTIRTEQDLIVCPTTINISMYDNNKFPLGAQNVSKYITGPHTGEISSKQLKSYGVKYCIVGHSERRQEQNESNKDTNEKIKMLLNEGITPVLCVGETKEERDNNTYKELITKEINDAIKDLNEEEQESIIVAYEPIYSIGTGIIPTNSEIAEIFKLIKEILPANKVLYGGSANEKNIDDLKQTKEIDGYLLGGLSLNITSLKEFLSKI
ncbi:MAG: triosephosphate isomerase [Bacilli bacterium]|nr:triosephosphate isomerase [Bacilli bacterium]